MGQYAYLWKEAETDHQLFDIPMSPAVFDGTIYYYRLRWPITLLSAVRCSYLLRLKGRIAIGKMDYSVKVDLGAGRGIALLIPPVDWYRRS